MCKNVYNINKKLWAKMSSTSQGVFNRVYRAMLKQEFFLHPDTARIPKNQWRTIAHNAAMTASMDYLEFVEGS